MAAPSNNTLLAYTDSIAQAVSDYSTTIAAASGVVAGASTINTGISGTGGSATLGRVLAYLDPTSEEALLQPTQTMVTNVAAYLTSVQAMAPFYQQLIPALNSFDAYINANVTAGGVNAWLAGNTLQVNSYFAAAFNYYAVNAVGMALRTSANAPVTLGAALNFPFAAVDPMISFTCGTGTSMTSSTPGSAASTKGGGTALLYIYKSNSSNAIGSATFTITYTNAAGASVTTTYSTTSGVPTASGTLTSGSVSLAVAGSAVTAVTGTGMTSGEIYSIGAKLVRPFGY